MTDEMTCPRCGKRIREHPADRCLDVWVAEVVMQLPPREHTFRYEEGSTPDGLDGWAGLMCLFCNATQRNWATRSDAPCVLHYSTNIAEAWTVVDRLQARPDEFAFGITRTACIDARWFVEFGGMFAADASLCLAICRAALKTKNRQTGQG